MSKIRSTTSTVLHSNLGSLSRDWEQYTGHTLQSYLFEYGIWHLLRAQLVDEAVSLIQDVSYQLARLDFKGN